MFTPQVPIVSDGGHYFTIAELRAMAPELANVTKFPDAMLEVKRQEAEEDFEALAHRAFVPRTDVCRVWGHGGQYLPLNFRDIRSITSGTLAGQAVSIAGVIADTVVGALKHPGTWPEGLYTVTYSHGLDAPPAAVRRAVITLAKIYAIPSAIDPRATAVINSDVGGFRISVGNAKTGATGIPDVDAAARRYGDNTPAVG